MKNKERAINNLLERIEKVERARIKTFENMGLDTFEECYKVELIQSIRARFESMYLLEFVEYLQKIKCQNVYNETNKERKQIKELFYNLVYESVAYIMLDDKIF